MKQNNTLILRQEHPFSLAFATWFTWCIYISIGFVFLWLLTGGINELDKGKGWWEPLGAIASLVLRAGWTIKSSFPGFTIILPIKLFILS